MFSHFSSVVPLGFNYFRILRAMSLWLHFRDCRRRAHQKQHLPLAARVSKNQFRHNTPRRTKWISGHTAMAIRQYFRNYLLLNASHHLVQSQQIWKAAIFDAVQVRKRYDPRRMHLQFLFPSSIFLILLLLATSILVAPELTEFMREARQHMHQSEASL